MQKIDRRSFLKTGVAATGGLLLGSPVQSPVQLIRPQLASNLSADPDVVEVELVAREDTVSFGNGIVTNVYTFNGSIPGPTIEGKLGDRLIVHFTNLLPEETTIHWHGLELPANMDGSNISQHPIPSGGTYRYEFTLLRAATFWYHPHIRTFAQVERGLYGMLVVRDPDEDTRLGLPASEHYLVLDDVRLNLNGQISEPFPDDPLENAATQANGREGNTLLVNGEINPLGAVQRGVPQRLRLVNVSNTRFMRISIPGHRMFRIGGDGGLLTAPIEIPPIGLVADPDGQTGMISDPDPFKGVLLTPAERADVVFTPTGDDSTIVVQWHDIGRGRRRTSFRPRRADDPPRFDGIGLDPDEEDGKDPPQTLLTLNLVGEGGGEEYVPPGALREIEAIDTTGAESIAVDFGHTFPDSNGDMTFFVARSPTSPLPFEMVTPDIAPVVTVGETRLWEIINRTPNDHNFHSHGFIFQFIETEFTDVDNASNNFVVRAAYLEDKDTIRIPGAPGARLQRSQSITRLAAKFDDAGREGQVEAFGKVPGGETSGGWVFHCHILEHADRGMMSFLQVMNPEQRSGTSEQPFTVADRGGMSVISAGESESVSVGSARIQPDLFRTVPTGLAVFRFRQNGILVSEASVPASPLLTSGRIYAEVNGPVNTGLAIANANDVAATINFFFTDTSGTDIGHASFTLGANEQRAAFLNQEPFNAGTSLQGTFTFTSTVPVSVIALRGLTNEPPRSEFLMTTLPVASLTPATEDTIYLPRFVDGLGWTTRVILVNPTDQTITGTVQFLGTGTDTTAAGPVTLMLTDGRIDSDFTYQVPARSSRVLQTSNSGTLLQGSVRVVRDSGSGSASGLVILSGAAGSLTFTEAGVPASPASTAFRMYAEVLGTPGAIGSIRSGVAISNTSLTPTTANFELTTLDGSSTGLTASAQVPGSGHIAKFVDELFPTLTSPFQGVLRLTSTTTSVAVVGLRLHMNERREFLITTTAPTNEAAPTTTEEQLFPHIVDGEGWTTQFILYSGVAGQSSSGTLRFLSRDGTPLDLVLQ